MQAHCLTFVRHAAGVDLRRAAARTGGRRVLLEEPTTLLRALGDAVIDAAVDAVPAGWWPC